MGFNQLCTQTCSDKVLHIKTCQIILVNSLSSECGFFQLFVIEFLRGEALIMQWNWKSENFLVMFDCLSLLVPLYESETLIWVVWFFKLHYCILVAMIFQMAKYQRYNFRNTFWQFYNAKPIFVVFVCIPKKSYPRLN